MGKRKFKVVSRIYGDNFNTVTFIVFNKETGKFKKHVFENYKTEDYESEIGVRADTAKNIQDEIIRLFNRPPKTKAGFIWNDALAKAANCCNGYEFEV